MLSKLLKHEYRATARIMLPIYVLVAGASLLFNVFMRLADKYDNVALEFFRITSVSIYGMTLLGALVVTFGLMVFRFYKNYMTDEGYLMFTLPVSTSQLILSKLLVAMTWTVLTALAVGLGVFLGCLGLFDWNEVLPAISDALSPLLGILPSSYLPLMGVNLFVSAVSNFLLIYAAISLGHSFANKKILLSVVFYFAFNAGIRSVSSILGIFLAVISDKGTLFSGEASEAWFSSYTTLSSILSITLGVIFAVVFYIVTRLLLKKRLNLQ
ncbi:MAG: hypothetical protein II458_02530 [Oscillospiraceae bacterium]|nr:hypothetical protein [Oscillospiraceae bacterium]